MHLETAFPISARLPVFTERNEPVSYPIVSYDLPPAQNPMLEGLSAAPDTFHGMHVGLRLAQREDLPNALACETTEQARQLIALLGLDTDRWIPFGIGQALTGYRFEKALVVYRARESLVGLEQAAEWITHLRTKCDKLVLV